MATARRSVSGFSLVEMLIAVAIFSMLVALASYAISLFGKGAAAVARDHDEIIARSQKLDLVIRALRDSVPWVVRDAGGSPGFYFLGRSEGMTFVSASPIFNPDGLSVIRLFAEAESDRAGGFRLVYEEAPLFASRLTAADQVLPFQHRLVIRDGLSRASFRYFGWASLEAGGVPSEDQEPGQVVQKPEWSREFDGLRRRIAPEKAGISINETELVVEISSRGRTTLGRYWGDEQ